MHNIAYFPRSGPAALRVTRLRQDASARAARRQRRPAGVEWPRANIDEVSMKLSARNSIPGRITNVKLGPVSAEVSINVAPGIDIVSVISAASAQDLKLQAGMSAYAVIKASNVMVGVDHA
jgi:molybdopterin-binding protein